MSTVPPSRGRNSPRRSASQASVPYHGFRSQRAEGEGARERSARSTEVGHATTKRPRRSSRPLARLTAAQRLSRLPWNAHAALPEHPPVRSDHGTRSIERAALGGPHARPTLERAPRATGALPSPINARKNAPGRERDAATAQRWPWQTHRQRRCPSSALRGYGIAMFDPWRGERPRPRRWHGRRQGRRLLAAASRSRRRPSPLQGSSTTAQDSGDRSSTGGVPRCDRGGAGSSPVGRPNRRTD